MPGSAELAIPGAPVHRLDCCDAQEFYISRHGTICFDKVPAVRHTSESESVTGKCRFCEKAVVVEFDKRVRVWSVRSYAPVYQPRCDAASTSRSG
jgi:hypothetical protein